MKIIKAFTSQAKSIFGIKTQNDKLDELYGKKRQVFGKPVVKTPWWSLARMRNQVLAAVGIFLYIFAAPIGEIKNAFHRGHRMERELRKFEKHLDELEGK